MWHACECAKLTSITKSKGVKSRTRQRHPSVMRCVTGAGSPPLPLQTAAVSTSAGKEHRRSGGRSMATLGRGARRLWAEDHHCSRGGAPLLQGRSMAILGWSTAALGGGARLLRGRSMAILGRSTMILEMEHHLSRGGALPLPERSTASGKGARPFQGRSTANLGKEYCSLGEEHRCSGEGGLPLQRRSTTPPRRCSASLGEEHDRSKEGAWLL